MGKLYILFLLCVASKAIDGSQCLSCDSNNDPRCAQNPENIESTCNSTNSRCYTRTVDGRTLRECDNLDENICKNDTSCSICVNLDELKNCNNGVFPGNRLTCYHCKGNLKSNCFKNINNTAKPCKTYHPNDKCFIRKTDSEISRGCVSDVDSNCLNSTRCKVCGNSGCNNDDGSSQDIPIAPNSAVSILNTLSVAALMGILHLILN